jgi:hypothetical protein
MYLSICFFIALSWLFVGAEQGKMKLLLLRYIAHQLHVANYYRSSEGWIVWSRANGEDAQPLEFVSIHRGVLSCGADSGCALEEEFGAVIPDTMLRAYQGGFSVKFYADTGQDLVIHLTSQQIQQQLKAIEDFQASRKK